MENYTQNSNPEVIKKISLVISGIIIVLIIFFLLLFYKSDIKKFAEAEEAKIYPEAGEMPPALKLSIKEVLARLEKALGKYDQELKAEMNPGLSEGKIANFAKKENIELPKEVINFFAWHNGSRKNDSSLEWFIPLEGSLKEVSKKRKTVEDAKYSGEIADIGLANLTAYQQNWIPIYQNASFYRLSFDVSRKPEEGAYFWAGSNQKGYFFFPTMQNALTALCECFEQKAFMTIDKIDQSSGIHKRNEIITGEKPKQLLVNTKKVRDIMSKYGTWVKAEGFLRH